MIVWGLDLGTATGFAYGEPGEAPVSGSLLLKKKSEPRGIALGNLVAFLADQWSRARPDLVAKEAPMTLQAFACVHSSEANVRFHHSLHGVVEAMCARFQVPMLVEKHPSTVRKHFLGRANFGDRASTKWECVLRCRLLRYIPQDCEDEDRADSLAYWDWACATYASKSLSTEKLYLFGEKPAGADDDAE